jgi:ribosomal protein S12 methylthiotransferase accessory factor YcaO
VKLSSPDPSKNALARNMYEIIDTPFEAVKTVRMDINSGFRPCSTGTKISDLVTRVAMERAEMDFVIDKAVFASAAHESKKLSIENAKCEAIERISLAAWWSCERSFVAKLSNELIKLMLMRNNLTIPENYSVNIGFVESACSGYYVACSILLNDNKYPYVVLGGGCSKDSGSAAEKAFYESVQSWAATEWIDTNSMPNKKVYWDTLELKKRIADLNMKTVELSDDQLFISGNIFDKLNSRVTAVSGIYITEIFESSISMKSHTTIQLARLAMKNEENISVYTPHNV